MLRSILAALSAGFSCGLLTACHGDYSIGSGGNGASEAGGPNEAGASADTGGWSNWGAAGNGGTSAAQTRGGSWAGGAGSIGTAAGTSNLGGTALATDASGPDAANGQEAGNSPDVPDAPSMRLACNALAELAGKAPFSPRTITSALFTKDRSAVVLQLRTTHSASDDVVLVRLPSGDVTSIASQIYSMEWLTPGQSLLLRNTNGELIASSLDGATSKRLTSTGNWSCSHRLSPDGKKLFSLVGSCSMDANPLDLIDTETGAAVRLSTAALNYGAEGKAVAVSPGSKFAAFLSKESLDGGGRTSKIHVVDREGRDYAIASQPGASYPSFPSDDLLVFQTRTSTDNPSTSELRGHISGSGDSSYLIASGRDYQPFFGYEFSQDRSWVLGAKRDSESARTSTELLAIALDGSGERLLASDLFAYWSISMAIDPFGFSGDGKHVLYATGNSASPTKFSVATVPLDTRTSARVLGGDREYASSPISALVALPENAATSGGLRVVDLAKEQDVCKFTGGVVSSPAFLPDGRGLIFSEYTPTGSGRLVYLSVPGCSLFELARLDDDRQADASPPATGGFGLVDPTSCFVIAHSNANVNAGASLVLLPE